MMGDRANGGMAWRWGVFNFAMEMVHSGVLYILFCLYSQVD